MNFNKKERQKKAFNWRVSILDRRYLSSSEVPLATISLLRVRSELPSSKTDCSDSIVPSTGGRLEKKMIKKHSNQNEWWGVIGMGNKFYTLVKRQKSRTEKRTMAYPDRSLLVRSSLWRLDSFTIHSGSLETDRQIDKQVQIKTQVL